MQGPVGVINLEPATQRVQADRRSGEFLARHLHSIKGAVHGNCRFVQPAKFRIEELHVKGRIVNDQDRIIANELDEIIGNLCKDRLIF